jgi:hypothetical protein
VRDVCVRVECAGAMGDMDDDIILGVQPGVAAPTDHPLDLHTPQAVIRAFYEFTVTSQYLQSDPLPDDIFLNLRLKSGFDSKKLRGLHTYEFVQTYEFAIKLQAIFCRDVGR